MASLPELTFFIVALNASLLPWSVTFAHGEKILGPNVFDALVLFSSQAVSHALWRDMDLIYKLNDIVVVQALVLRHCRQSVRQFHAYGSGLDRS